jgi:hypothetical protein
VQPPGTTPRSSPNRHRTGDRCARPPHAALATPRKARQGSLACWNGNTPSCNPLGARSLATSMCPCVQHIGLVLHLQTATGCAATPLGMPFAAANGSAPIPAWSGGTCGTGLTAAGTGSSTVVSTDRADRSLQRSRARGSVADAWAIAREVKQTRGPGTDLAHSTRHERTHKPSAPGSRRGQLLAGTQIPKGVTTQLNRCC